MVNGQLFPYMRIKLLEEFVITLMYIYICRSASVITLEQCELLCVEANYMKQLYKVKYVDS